ncbi:hypothetical protein A5813_000925 [Enterococcus faecium]|uniref:hypothetical protein n=1 Tax=Enterococcus faecium TaxID=1352 RepID=UPI000B720DE1|nr:hypothetical protein [Enterococcus faecium]OTO55485.1 hypothetical protein A5813_000925 [Enterococcus faecium]OTO59034.1 hypothetical protein A5812_002035 [Enterococcus faecium]
MASVLNEPVYRVKEYSNLNRLYVEKEKQGKVISEEIKRVITEFPHFGDGVLGIWSRSCMGIRVESSVEEEYKAELTKKEIQGYRMVAKTGDYIIRGVEGEIYPCKPDIFEKTYEVASQQSQLDDNQKIVLEWLKSNRNSLKVPMLAFYELAELADENTNLAYHQLDSKQEIEVLAAFAQWGLGQEEAE